MFGLSPVLDNSDPGEWYCVAGFNAHLGDISPDPVAQGDWRHSRSQSGKPARVVSYVISNNPPIGPKFKQRSNAITVTGVLTPHCLLSPDL